MPESNDLPELLRHKEPGQIVDQSDDAL